MKSIAGLLAAVGIAVALSSGVRAQGCTFSISRTSVLAGPEGPIFARTTVTASAPGCQWSSTTPESWITVNPNPQSGTGDAAITLAPNPSATRIGLVTVAGHTVTVTQQATPCVTSLVPNTLTFPYPGFGNPSEQSKSVTVNAPPDCHWQHGPWPINVFPNPPLGGVGTRILNVGIITLFPGQGNTLNVGIGSLPLTMTRLDPPCVFTLTPSAPTVSVNGGSGVINVAGTGTDCSFTPTVDGSSGLTLTNASAQTAPATLEYTMTPNPGQFERQVAIRVPNASAVVTQNGTPVRVEMSSFNFAGIKSSGTVSPLSAPEDIQLTIDEQPGSAWTVTVNQPWLVVTPNSGSGAAKLRVSVDAAAAASLPLTGAFTFHFANISIAAAFAPASVRTMVASVALKAPGTSAAPTGVFETPLNNTTVSGATPVTGWTVDDISVARIHLYRDAVPGEAGTEIYIGDAIRVKGARPDIAAKGFPGGRSAGWGYMLLTNVLPGGDGVFTLSAYVDDVEGLRTLLGRRTITVDNASATRPFGTIDFPAQGETVSGTIVNRGWVLAKSPKFIPFDGSTIRVYIDGAFVGPVTTYNHPRPDVKAFFGGLANSDGPEARFTLDTTILADGVHTIAWGVLDSNNDPEGIGSRYFTVQNGLSSLVAAPAEADARSLDPVTRMPMLKTDVWSREGMDETGWATRVETDADGKRTLHGRRAARVELFLDPTLRAACGTYTGHLLTGEVAGALPPGASLDAQRGIFRWQPSAETAGAFEFVFVQRGCDTIERRIPVRVVIEAAR